MAKRNEQRPVRRAPRGGYGWLVLFLLIGGTLALFVFMPEVFGELLGSPPAPRDPGEAPIDTSAANGDVRERQVSLETRGYQRNATNLAEVVEDDDTGEDTGTRVEDDDGAGTDQPEFADLERGRTLMAELEAAYRGYEWERVDSLASQLVRLDVPGRLKARAEEKREYSVRLADVFAKLGNKEELWRNVETHPSAVVVKIRGSSDIFVPLTDYTSRDIYTGDDPVGFVKDGLARAGKVALMDTSFIPSEVKADIVDMVAAADVEQIRSGRRERFETNLDKIKTSQFRGDAVAWYNAARYAYRNRLDVHVVDLLEHAIARDPEIAKTIREDKASDLYANMVLNLENDRRKGASGWLLKLKNQYGDTSVYQQAQAHYNGDVERLRKEQEAAIQARRERREQARQERIARARAREDEQAVKEIEEEEDIYEAPASTETGPVSGDLAQANAWYDKGYGYYRQAMGMTATHERDTLYSKALDLFKKALPIYNDAVRGGNTDCQQRLIDCNRAKYHCIKMLRPF